MGGKQDAGCPRACCVLRGALPAAPGLEARRTSACHGTWSRPSSYRLSTHLGVGVGVGVGWGLG